MYVACPYCMFEKSNFCDKGRYGGSCQIFKPKTKETKQDKKTKKVKENEDY